jgi:hypothetical protein
VPMLQNTHQALPWLWLCSPLTSPLPARTIVLLADVMCHSPGSLNGEKHDAKDSKVPTFLGK